MPQKSKYPSTVHLIDERPMGVWIMEAMEKFGPITAIIDGVTGQETTYSQLHSWTRSVETGLHDHGIKVGDMAAAVLGNCAEYMVAWGALLSRGAALSGVNPLYTQAEIVRHFKDCGAVIALTDVENMDKVVGAAREVAAVRKVFVVCSGAEGEKLGASSLVAPFHSLRVLARPLPPVRLDPRTAVAALPYSSGTTGVPKGVRVTHYGLAAMASSADTEEMMFPDPGQRVLCYLPFFHIYGLALNLMLCVIRGATAVTVPRFVPRQFLQLMQDHRIPTLYAVPPILVFLTKDPAAKDFDLSALRGVTVGAAPAGHDLITEFKAKYPQVEYMVQGYGMTECSGASMVAPRNAQSQTKFGSCGVLIPNFEACVMEPESGRELTQTGPDHRGEIWMRSPSLMAGYHGRPSATAATIDAQGWLHTGDIGYVDDDGYWYVVDRIKELIKVKAFQVAPAELEDLLLSCPGVADVAVIGVPHPKDGEVPKAFVVKHQGARLTEKQVSSFVAEKAAPYKQLKGGVKFVAELPKSASGKILRRLLRDQEEPKAKL